MGNISSTYWKDILESTNTNKDDDDLEFESTPNGKGYRLLKTDPRSPSGYISRTPIQVEKTPNSNENAKKTCENKNNSEWSPYDTDGSKNGSTKGKKLFEADGTPRSPRQPLKTIYGTRIGSPFSYLRHKQVKNLRTELEKEREMENLSLDTY